MNLYARVRNILVQPEREWPAIAAEPTDLAALYRDYILMLAAIPAVCLFLGLAVLGAPYIGRFALSGALSGAILLYVRTLIGVLIAAFIIGKLAPTFNSSGDTAQALKVVAYAYTPVWLAGVFRLSWALSTPATLIASLYAIYLFYLGLAPVMQTPTDRIVPYMLVSAMAIFIVNFLIVTVVRGMP